MKVALLFVFLIFGREEATRPTRLGHWSGGDISQPVALLLLLTPPT